VAPPPAAVTGRPDQAVGYRGNNLALPVADRAAALPFYETVLGFRVVSTAAWRANC
jgi:hypothetical protein